MFKLTAFGVVLTWVAGVVLNLALIGTIIYVAHHFIAKYW